MTNRISLARICSPALFSILFAAASATPVRAQCTDWAPGFALSGNGVNGEVVGSQVWNDGSGPGLYIAGGFSLPGGIGASVARWDGTSWSQVGDLLNGRVWSIAVHDDGSGPTLYAGGQFFPNGTSSAWGVAKLVGSTWTAFTDSPDGTVLCVASYDGGGPGLYIGGNFTLIGGASFPRIAKWDGTSWSSLAGGTNGTVQDLIVFDDGTGAALYAAGPFNSAGGTPVNGIAKWNGSSWSAVGALGGITDLAVFDDGSGPKLYASCGPSDSVQRWTGSTWQVVGTFGQAPHALGVHDDGSGPALYEADYGSVRRWNGSTWTVLGTGPAGLVDVLESFDAGTGGGPKLYAGGLFTTCGGRPASNIDYWGVPCFAPVILTQPLDRTAVFPQSVVFSAVADGTAPLSYQWRKDGVPVANVSGKIEGATTPTMTLYYWSLNDEGSYDCQVTNPYGVTTSDEAVLTVPGNGTTGAPIVLTKILLPPEPVPGLPGATFTSFGSSIQAATSDVSFYGRISGAGNTDQSLDLWQSGTTQVLDMNWAQAPGTPSGVLFDHFGSFLIGADGKLAFSAVLLGPGIDGLNNRGLWYHDSGGEDLVARFGDPAAGGPAGSTFRNNLTLESFSDSGQVLFSGTLYNGGSFVAGGYWVWDRASGQALVALNGQPAPGTSANFANLNYRQMVESRSGTVALFSDLSGGPSWGLWTGQPGALQLVALSGDQVPGYPAGTTFVSVDSPVLNEIDDLAFRAMIQDPGGSTRWTVLRWRAGVFDTIVSQGDPAPGIPGETMFSGRPIVMNENGSLVIQSSIASGSCTDNCPSYGYFFADASGIDRIVTNRADPLPDAPPGFTLGSLGSVALNNTEQVVVCVTLYYGQSFGATYGWTREHGLFPVAIPGSQIEVTPGDYRTVAGAGMSYVDGGVGSGEGPSRNLNDAGQVLIGFGFSDFVSGIFTGQFTTYESRYFAPGTPFCAGDGSLATPCPCGNVGLPGHGCDNSIATGGAILTCVGGASLATDTLTLTSAGERLTALSVFLQGTTRLSAGVPYGDGVRCVGGILKRIGVKAAVGGVVTYPGPSDLSISARSDALGDVIHPGETRYYQIYYRDPTQTFCPNPPGGTFNTSSGQIIPWFP